MSKLQRLWGMESVLDKSDRPRAGAPPDFDEWVSARSQSLLRLAYVLTGQADDVDAYVRRMVAPW